MSIIEALILGIVQGATEFLPISSSGHLVLGQYFLGIEEPQLLFDIVLHVGTLLAIVAFYRRDLAVIVTDSLSGLRRVVEKRSIRAFLEGKGARIAFLVAVATIPTGFIGYGLEKILDPEGGARIVTAPIVCGILVLNGVMLYANRWLIHRPEVTRSGVSSVWNLTIWTAFAVGIAQGIAVMPGVSRSGTTITLALALGISRVEAARFSFLMSIPAILGALVLKFDPAAFSMAGTGSSQLPMFLVGAALAAIVGYVCLRWLVILLERARFHHFAWYCWVVGLGGLLGFYVLG